MPTDAVIRLRRPAVISLSDREWLPDPHLRGDAERVWASMQHANPHAFDGRLIQVAGVHRNGAGAAVIQGFPCAYRWYAAQVQDPECELGCRPLGVKGVTRCGDQVLIGRRAAWTASFPGQVEFAPSGGVEPGDSPEAAVAAEFAEEVGGLERPVPRAVAVLYDASARSWEVVLMLDVEGQDVAPRTDEYESLTWCRPGELPDDLTPIAQRIRTLVFG
ncbi:MAG: NUDIX domain-containing protein [Phycisphaerales bacterium]|nr:NUDIX domain-containing protein [Phycisphaerales bacterium]